MLANRMVLKLINVRLWAKTALVRLRLDIETYRFSVLLLDLSGRDILPDVATKGEWHMSVGSALRFGVHTGPVRVSISIYSAPENALRISSSGMRVTRHRTYAVSPRPILVFPVPMVRAHLILRVAVATDVYEVHATIELLLEAVRSAGG